MKKRAILGELDPYVPGTRIAGGIKLSSNENPLGPSPKAMEAIARVAGDVNRYPDGGMTDLKSALAAKWGVSPDMVVVGNGSDEILVMIAGATAEPGTNVVTAEHTFSQYGFASKIFGAEVRTTPMTAGRFDLDAIAAAVDADTRIVFLCSPNNPTGRIVTKNELDGFLARLPADVLVVVDEAYGEYVDSADYPDTIGLLGEHDNLIRLRTFSKIYGLAALRVGYAVAQPAVIEAVSRLRQPFNVGTIAQAAATAALGDIDFVHRSLEVNRREKARLQRYLDDARLPYLPTEANFVCVDFSAQASATVLDALRAHGITLRPLGSFGLPDHVRISIGTRDEMDALYAALDTILGATLAGG